MQLNVVTVLIALSVRIINSEGSVKQPNIVVILTDDQDYELNSMQMMKKVRSLIGDRGVTFENMFVSTPICCPSRSSIFSGRYVHNHRGYNNSCSGGCNSGWWQKNIEPTSFPVHLKSSGYTTFYAGKYLNEYGFNYAGGTRVPPGWDSWNGLIGYKYFYNYPMSRNGTKEFHGRAVDDYLTNVIKKRADEFIKYAEFHTPFFMMLAPTAPHTPATPISPYLHSFSSLKAPRTPHYGTYSNDKHWLLRQVLHPLTDDVKNGIDELFRNRWRSLQSVDDLVEDVVQKLDNKKLLDNTYIIYSADNGYHLGQFCLPWDKRMPYEFDIRVPLLIKGPNIPKGARRKEPVLNIDLGPTILSLAGIRVPSYMDGRSFKTLLRSANASRSIPWRNQFLVEYYGQNDGAPHRNCPKKDNSMGQCFTEWHCVCGDSTNNTYNCLRKISPTTDGEMFCQFEDSDKFQEYYNLQTDPYQMENGVKSLSQQKLSSLKKTLKYLKGCSGRNCWI